MSLKEYIAVLNQFLKDNPKSGDLPVVYAKDDEGNGYQKLSGVFPSLMQVEDMSEYCMESAEDQSSPNCICIN